MDKVDDIFLDVLSSKIIAYNVTFTKLTKSVTAGILLSQLMYWAKVKRWGEFYKTDSELLEETGMTLEELRTAKKKIQHLVDINRKGVPAKTHYKVKKKELLEALNNLYTDTNSVMGNPDNLMSGIPTTRSGESQQLEVGNPNNYYNETENTTEITSKEKDISKDISKKKNLPSGSVENTLGSFKREIIQNNPNANRDFLEREVQKFIDYWTEPNLKNGKQRWEFEKTFEPKRRFRTWIDRATTKDAPKHVFHHSRQKGFNLDEIVAEKRRLKEQENVTKN